MLSDAVEQLHTTGAIGVIPTDTVYGVVARAQDQIAVQRLYELKHREGKPGTLIAASIEQLEALGFKKRYLTAVQQFWPGAVSVVIPCGIDLTYLHQGKGSIAVRIPDNATVQYMLQQTGPLLTSSANNPAQPTAVTVQQAQAYFYDDVDFYIDGGDLSGRPPSTVIQVIDDEIVILRQGAAKIHI